VGPGDVVITVSHSFVATANAIRHCQAEPVFVDIDLQTGNLDPAALAELLDRECEKRPEGLFYRPWPRLAQGESPLARLADPRGRVAALLVVHQVGMPADLGRILPLASQHGLPVVEDAACAIGSEISLDGGLTWDRIGRPHGLAACFSFHPRKVITTGDGGMVTTDDPALAANLARLRQHGMETSDLARHQSREIVFESYVTTGYNYRLTDIQAAVGLAQMQRLDAIVAERRRQARVYQQELAGLEGLRLPQEPAYARSNWQSFVVRLEDPGRQRSVMQALLERGVSTRRGVMCAHLEPPYAAAWPTGCLPQSELARDAGIILPLFPGLAEGDLLYVVKALREALGA
jgi:dTDP-4-amino-4,6-dideoxygalactose transaminase